MPNYDVQVYRIFTCQTTYKKVKFFDFVSNRDHNLAFFHSSLRLTPLFFISL